MSPLTLKLWRDLRSFRGQVLAIAVVIATGVMIMILGAASLEAVSKAQQRFYDSHQFAQLFSHVSRAPEHLLPRIQAMDGVSQVESLLRTPVRMAVPGYDKPVRGLLLSLPDGQQPRLNRLHLREGSLPDRAQPYGVVLNEPFAEAHGLRSGDTLTAIIEGREQQLVVTGIGLSPEFIYQIGPADILPDYRDYGVLWMNRSTLARALDMQGAFNSLALTLQLGAVEQDVIAALDQLLEPYGTAGAFGRDDQVSHHFLTEEKKQLQVTATVLPAIFLGVSAFLLSVLMGRIVRTQRQQVAVLKAFGYANGSIVWHYAQFTLLVVVLGGLLGTVLGAWFADGLVALYAEYFRFPDLRYQFQPRLAVLAMAIAALAAMAGTGRALWQAVQQQPAEAMRPPAPERFSPGWLERSALARVISQPSRIILRNLTRHRTKAVLSILGIALSVGLLVLGSYQWASVKKLVDIQYRLIHTMDLHLSFTGPVPERALAELRSLPGVQYVEGYRSVPVRLVNGTRQYLTGIQGLEPEPQLRRLIDSQHQPVALPTEGMVMTHYLADYLGLAAGDSLEVQVMDGAQPRLTMTLARVIEEPVGVGVYLERRQLNRLLGEGPAINGAWLMVDGEDSTALFERLWQMPKVAAIGHIREAREKLTAYLDDTMLVFMGVLLLLAAASAFAVVFNNARIAFAERARELATLRVLGLSQREVGWVVMGEILLLTLLAIPVGWLLGVGFALLVAEALSTDMFRLPVIFTPQVFAFAALGVLLAALLSGLLMLRHLRRLDMVGALKTE
ncbi:MAG: ABC transporter permease [Marinobacter sp.]|nr:ABC transporter permease [Marinobacter sp.]